MKNAIYFSLIITILGIGFTGCDKTKEPEEENEEELITTLELTFINSAVPTDVRTFVFRDEDGPGGNAPSQFDDISLEAGVTYSLSVVFLNESVSPAEDITEEVAEEGADHQVFFTADPTSLITITYDDSDDNGDPIGLENTAVAGSAGVGTFMVVLKHQPGIKDGNSETGETDVEVNFEIEIL